MMSAGASEPSVADAQRPEPRWLWWPLLLLAVAAVAGFLLAASQRVFYPHELEWMEGALADHAARVHDGLPLYCEPGPEHVPFLYAPLFFWLGGLGMVCGLDGIVALRLVAVAFSIGSAMLIGHWVRRASGQLAPGLVATGLFFAGYGWLAWWYDLARNDSLFVFLCLATSYQLRHGGARRWLWAGLLAAIALLAKQSALMWLPAVGIGALLWDWRTAVRFGSTAAGAMAVEVGVMHLLSDGWSTFYLFEMPRHHGWVDENALGFWSHDVPPMLPLVALAIFGFARRIGSERSDAIFLAAFGVGGMMTSWLSRMHVGGFDNVVMYGFAVACVLGPLAAARARTTRVHVAATLLLLGQFGWLGYEAWCRGTGSLLPSAAHREAHEELAAFVEQQDGPVWIPAHGHIAYRAGKGTGAHGQAIFDLLQLLPKLPDGTFDFSALHQREKLAGLTARSRNALDALFTHVHAALREARFAAIVVDDIGAGLFPALFAVGLAGPDGRVGTDDDPYARWPRPLLTRPSAIRPLLGFEVRNPYAFVRR